MRKLTLYMHACKERNLDTELSDRVENCSRDNKQKTV